MEQRSGFFSAVDDLVIQRAKRGDGEAFERIYSTFSDAVFTLARRLCASTEEAEDVLQETFLEVAKSLGRYRGRGALGAWVRRITVSKAIDARRRRRRKRRVLAEVGESIPAPTDGAAADTVRVGWQRVDLERALDRLPREARMVVWLHDVEGLTHAEIAELFKRTVSFSKSQLARARVRLREELHGHGGFEDESEERGEVGVGGP